MKRATAGTTEKHDVHVDILLGDPSRDGTNTVRVESPVKALFGADQTVAVNSVLQEAGIRAAEVTLTDNHALDFVIRARVRAAVAQLVHIGEVNS